MIAVDSSAVLAILLSEPDAARYAAAIEHSERAAISAASAVEIGVVMLGQDPANAVPTLEQFWASTSLRIEAVQAAHVSLALDAYQRYGKRRRHPAKLNFGDCFSYALAKALGAPLLFKGNDFSHTDISAVL